MFNRALLDICGSSKSALDVNVNPLTIRIHEWMVMNESMLTLFGQVLVRYNFHFHNLLLPFVWSRSGSSPSILVIFISINCFFRWSYLLLWNDSTFSTSTKALFLFRTHLSESNRLVKAQIFLRRLLSPIYCLVWEHIIIINYSRLRK